TSTPTPARQSSTPTSLRSTPPVATTPATPASASNAVPPTHGATCAPVSSTGPAVALVTRYQTVADPAHSSAADKPSPAHTVPNCLRFAPACSRALCDTVLLLRCSVALCSIASASLRRARG